ncbi:MAG: hypothetical protein J6I96_07140 [Oscillospiraceae bacterium]|nr:hypothetical protein [Oscillospiraceae bacterium]
MIEQFDSADVQQNKSTVMLGAILQIFLPILFFIPYVSNKESEYCRFYANQGLWLLICWAIGGAVNVIPLLGQIASIVIIIATTVFSIMNAVNANNGVRKPIPFVGEKELLK